MKAKSAMIFRVVILVLTFALSANLAHADDHEMLQRCVSQLQSSPQNSELREKIIKLAQALDPKPGIPEETKRFMARGEAALESAKEEKDYKETAEQFEKASNAAPWLGAPYYNLGIIYDKAGDYSSAIRNFKLYLLASPNASDAEKVQTMIYKLEFKQEKAAKEAASPEAQARKAKAVEDAFLDSLEGAEYEYQNDQYFHTIYKIRGRKILVDSICRMNPKDSTYDGEHKEAAITGKRFVVHHAQFRDPDHYREGEGFVDGVATFSDDGRTLFWPTCGSVTKTGKLFNETRQLKRIR